ncbi:MAG: DUF3795 domain-containing protein [Pirellulales bacterium]|nr:DUF3795 domain-containing protein [Pirellulales bacterium]
MIAYCGLDCAKCEASIATANDDDALRAKVAEEWSRTFHVDIKPEDIHCAGCRTPGVKVHYCESLCEVRKCALARKVDTCAACGDFPCGHLAPIFKMAPEAEAALRSLRT